MYFFKAYIVNLGLCCFQIFLNAKKYLWNKGKGGMKEGRMRQRLRERGGGREKKKNQLRKMSG